MRIFREISENYQQIEDLSPGYLEIKKVVESAENKYNRKLKKILNDIKLKSEAFIKMTNIDSMNVVNVDDILAVESPHELNVPQWDGFKSELVKVRVEKNELLKTQEERDNLRVVVGEKDQEIGDREKQIKELEKRVETKVARKPRKKKGEDSVKVGEEG